MARKPAPTTAHETKEPKLTPAKASEPQPTFIVNGAPATATVLRPWTDAEKRLPLWLRDNRLPRHVADPVEQVFLKDELPGPLANLWAMIHLASGAGCGILTVRRDHGTKPDAMDPAVFVQNVVFMLRSARDDVLKQTAAANIPVVSARLDALIGATKATLDAFMADNLDKIWCDNPTCDKRGRHLLPGPWMDAMKRSGEASEEAFRLSTFVGGDTTPTVSVSTDLLDRLQRTVAMALDAMATRDDTGIRGTGTDWKDVRSRLLTKNARNETYTGDRPLARELSCSPSTIKKAIKSSAVLKGWKARTARPKAAPKARDLARY